MSRRFLCPHFFSLLSQFQVLHLVSDPFELIFIYLSVPSLIGGMWDPALVACRIFSYGLLGSSSWTTDQTQAPLQWKPNIGHWTTAKVSDSLTLVIQTHMRHTIKNQQITVFSWAHEGYNTLLNFVCFSTCHTLMRSLISTRDWPQATAVKAWNSNQWLNEEVPIIQP